MIALRPRRHARTHARTGSCAKYLGAPVYKYAPDEIDLRYVERGGRREGGAGGGGKNADRARGQSRVTTEKYLAAEQIFIRL